MQGTLNFSSGFNALANLQFHKCTAQKLLAME